MEDAPTDHRRRWAVSEWLLGAACIAMASFELFVIFAVLFDRPGSRRAAPVIICSSNLRQIGLAMLMYAKDNSDRLPPSWGKLMEVEEFTTDVFICPSSDDTRAEGPTTQAYLDNFANPSGHHCSYMFTAAGLKGAELEPEDVLAYEPVGHHGGSFNMLFAGDVVDRYDVGDATIKAAYEKLLADDRANVRPLRWTGPTP